MRGRLLTGLLFAVLLSGCTGEIITGITDFFGDEPGKNPDGTPIPVVTVGAPAQLRLLNALEYRHTMEDVLGLSVSAPLSHADWGAGFDSGSGGQVQEALLSALIDESQSLAARYVSTRASSDFSCFDRANITDACMQDVIAKLGRRAWRRPLTTEERDTLWNTFSNATQVGGSRVDGAEAVVARLLLAPQSLYRSEIGTPDADGKRTLNAFERASLISYALTASTPDEALLADAEAGALDADALKRHVRRLWNSPRARSRIADVMRQWLGLTALDDMATRPMDFPKLASAAQGVSLKAEFDEGVATTLIDGDGLLSTLFNRPSALVNQHTAPLYGLSASGDSLTRAELNPLQRRGLLTWASSTSALSSSGDVSKDRPVLRGLMIKSRLLCEPVGPPSGVNTVAAANTAMQVPNFDQLTTREQYEAMMQQGQTCAACHAQFMPLGFSFGSYDALGQFRTSQRNRPVDTRALGVPMLGEVSNFDGALALSDALAGHDATALCFTRQLISYSSGVARTQYVDELTTALHHRAKSFSAAQAGTPLHVGAMIEAVLTSPEVFRREEVTQLTTPMPTGGGGGGAMMPTGGGGGGGGGVMMPAPATVLLSSGASLGPDASRRSSDGAYNLLYQLDGNLVLYRTSGGAVWASGTQNTRPRNAVMQADGNLVIYDENGTPVWHAHTYGNPGAQLFIEASGRLSIRTPAGVELWSAP
ncbi:MAG: DUF1592 domain-containing protein [Archangium sp.]|nr:DUF1592 domain-containing protein [Archangium sp.]